MSEQNTGEQTPDQAGNQPDPITNIKAEYSRKLGNVEAQLAQLAQSQQALMEQLKGKATPAPAEEDDEQLLYSKPAEYKKRIVESVKGEVSQMIESQNRAAAERQQTLAALVHEYPELNQADSDLHKETLKVLEGLPADQRSTSFGYKIAAYQAAASLGLPPKSKRQAKPKEGQEDFSFSGGKSNAPKKSNPKSDIDPKILANAELMGLNVNDEKVLESLKKNSKRNYSRFE